MEDNKTDINIYSILTRREIEITQLMILGNTDKEIAVQLSISFNTVRKHHSNILTKTHQKNVSGLIRFALNNGLIIR